MASNLSVNLQNSTRTRIREMPAQERKGTIGVAAEPLQGLLRSCTKAGKAGQPTKNTTAKTQTSSTASKAETAEQPLSV